MFLPFGSRGVQRDAAEAALVQDLVCYDRVWVLTDHMAAVGVLLGLIGSDSLIRLLEEGSLGFVRDRYLIGWPRRTDGYGATPVLSIMGMRHADGEPTFSTYCAGDLAVFAIRGYGLSSDTEQRIRKLVDESTVDFDWPPGSATNVDDDVAHTRRELEAYRLAALAIPGFPIGDDHFRRLIRDIGKPKSRLRVPKHVGVVTTEIRSGEALLASTAPVDQAQLAMIHLSLSDRFLRALKGVTGPVVLHTEPVVEDILKARVVQVGLAAGAQVADVLRAESVSFPVISTPASLDYQQLLRARDTAAARAFWNVVDQRDAEGTRELLPVYLETLNKELGKRWSIRLARWLAAVAIAKAVGGGFPLDASLFAADQVLDKILGRLDARYFIDTSLRRVADPSLIDIVTRE
jgi:hypothetical protein